MHKDSPVLVYVLENFWLNNLERFHLGEETTIRVSGEEEEKQIETFPRHFFPPSRTCFLMELYMNNPKPRIDQWPLWSALFALRLVKSGGVGYSKPLVNPKRYIMTAWRPDHLANPYLLESNEIPDVQRIYSQLMKAKSDMQFMHVLRRFNASYNGPFYKRLEDLMAALEALLIFDRKVHAKNSTIQKRLECLISDKTKDIPLMRNTMNIAYNVRNYILHEARILDSQLITEVCEEVRLPVIKVFNLVSDVEEYARRAIRKWVMMLTDGGYLNSENVRKSVFVDQSPETSS